MTRTDSSRVLAALLGGLAVLAAVTTGVLADTQMGVIGDTECDTLRDRLVDGLSVCDEAVQSRLPWVITAAVLTIGFAVAAVVLLRRGRRDSEPRPRPVSRAVAGLALVASLALGWWSAHRLGEGSDDYCGSPITGAGSYPYDESKTADCADRYDQDRLAGLLGLGGAVLLVVVPAGVALARRRPG